MKMLKLRTSILASVCSLLAVIPNFSAVKNGDLKEITKPYLGVYDCQQAQLGNKDLLEDFSSIQLELKDGECFVLHYEDKDGQKNKVKGKYVYNEKEKEIALQMEGEYPFKRSFPLKNGQIIVSFPVGNKQLRLIFEQK